MADMAATEAEIAGLSSRWADIELEDEDAGVEAPADDSGAMAAAESWVVVGRFLTQRLIKVEYMRQVMASAWKPVSGVHITELQPNLFQFVFHHITDVRRVMDEGPWSFENCTLLCREVKDGQLPKDMVLDTVDLWVQVYNLPVGYNMVPVLEQTGNFLGKFLKIDERQMKGPPKAFYRIRVCMSVDKPLKRRMKLIRRDKSWGWVNFKYERLHTFCFFCGLLGHSEKFCLKARNSTLTVEQYPYGVWMRAGQARGPRPVGESWLLTEDEPPIRLEPVRVAPEKPVGVQGREEEEEEGVTALAKRRRQDSRQLTDTDTNMADSSKNLHQAGSGSQTRPQQ
ncbi:PREDICTED: uncharacterized protein LOC109173671 [Ipomoea nil]|uniref:uncharacterized protein LOC109173671 n=1 Tax=Ipomoea nil TaxID=35883 RepID=UPI00090194E2|nr:PREDICTED: uncharacterized protein LOC109173671 [Ipomoea nil]